MLAVARRLPGAALHPRPRPHRRADLAQAAQELAHRHRRDDCARRRAARRRPGDDADRDGAAARALPDLARPSRASSSGAGGPRPSPPRSNDRGSPPTGCCPSTGRRSPAAACASRTARSSRSRPDGPSDALRRRGDRPGLRQRALAPRVRGVRRASATARRSARGSRRTSRARAASTTRTCSRSRGCGVADSLRVGHHDDRRLQLLRRVRDRGGRARPARDRLPRGVRARPGDARRSSSRRSATGSPSRSSCGSASRRTRRTPARSTSTGGACRSASRSARISPRAASENEWLEHGERAAGRGSRRCSSRRPASAPWRRSSRCSGRTCSAPTASRSTSGEIALLAARDVPVAHCPRSNALLGCGIAPLAELRAAGVRVGLGTDSPASTPSFDMFEEMRAAIYAARARERRPEALLAAEALRLATVDAARALRIDGRGGYPDARQARRPDGRVARGKPVPSGRGSRGGRRLRRLAGTSARDDRRRADPLPKRRRGHSGERYAAPQAPPGANARAAAVAAAPKKQKTPEWQEELFFSRLRNHAKWVYVFLAVVFVLGFVLLGVGSGSNGLSDIFQSAFGSGSSRAAAPRSRSLQKKVDKQPQNATAWRDLATAYEQKQRTQDAVSALERYTALKPKDETRLLGARRAVRDPLAQLRDRLPERAARRRSTASPYAAFAPPATTVLGKVFGDPNGAAGPDRGRDPAAGVDEAADRLHELPERAEERRGRLQEAGRARRPDDVSVQYQLGQSAQAAGDYKTAIAAYQRFLKLSPVRRRRSRG